MYCGTAGYGGIYFGDSNSGNARYSGYVEYKNNENFFRIATSEAERFRITSTGLVGIGTNIPNEELHIHANGTSYVRFTDESSGTGATDGTVFGLDHPHLYAWNYEAGDFVVATNATEKLRVTSTGRVGINTTSPAVSLDLSNNTDAVALPTGTTAQRPSGTDAYIRKNSTNNALEFYNGTEWVEIITDYFPTGSTILG